MIQSRGRRRLVTLFVLVFLCLTAASPLAAAANTGGTSDAAHACQKGGYKELRRADGTRFANAGECVSFVARGGAFKSPAALSVSFEPTNISECRLIVNLVNFEPSATYNLTIEVSVLGSAYTVLSTDPWGAASFSIDPVPSGAMATVSTDGISVGPIPISCGS